MPQRANLVHDGAVGQGADVEVVRRVAQGGLLPLDQLADDEQLPLQVGARRALLVLDEHLLAAHEYLRYNFPLEMFSDHYFATVGVEVSSPISASKRNIQR